MRKPLISGSEAPLTAFDEIFRLKDVFFAISSACERQVKKLTAPIVAQGGVVVQISIN